MTIFRKCIILFIILLHLACCNNSNIDNFEGSREQSILNLFITLQKNTFTYSLDTINEKTNFINFDLDTLKGCDIFKDRANLIYYFSESCCSDCYWETLKMISYNKDALKDKITFISRFKDFRRIKLMFMEIDFDFPVYNIVSEDHFIGMETINMPFFGLISKDQVISLLYSPVKGDTAITQFYLENFSYRFTK